MHHGVHLRLSGDLVDLRLIDELLTDPLARDGHHYHAESLHQVSELGLRDLPPIGKRLEGVRVIVVR